jgi:hypothetical protein
VGSIFTGSVRAYVVRMLQRDGHPTPLGEVIASYPDADPHEDE